MEEKQTTLDDLARMIANGFADTANKADMEHLTKRVGAIETRLGIVESGLSSIGSRLSVLENGQEEIKLRLDNLAYKFEVKELTRRVDFLEQKLGIVH